jgi:nucleotide sugar dehydrogenase
MTLYLSSDNITGDAIKGIIKLTVIGLGQVGLPLALNFLKAGIAVTGADISESKIRSIENGICPLNTDVIKESFNQVGRLGVTTDIVKAVSEGNVHIMCLPTLLDDNKNPDLSAITGASETVGKGLKKGDAVILESSVYPGVTNTIVRPILENISGLKAGHDFGLACCSERIDPGNTEHRVDNTPKIVGAVDEKSAQIVSAVYGTIVNARIYIMTNCETAELVKLVENIYRDVNIAYINEIALLCQRINVDVLEVLEAASSKWSFNPYIPGAGVGGMCIPINPYYLMKCAEDVGLTLKMVRQAREINEYMPYYIIELTLMALRSMKKPVNEAKICLLGIAYKPDVSDSRGSPAEEIARELQKMGAKVVSHDPVSSEGFNNIDFEKSYDEAIKGSDVIVITMDHSSFKTIDLNKTIALTHKPLAIVDGKHVIVPEEAQDLGILYFGVGRRNDSERNIWNVGFKL